MREYREIRPKRQSYDYLYERIPAALVYSPIGWIVCLGWLLYAHLKGMNLSIYARFNIFQSIFLAILIYIFNIIVGIIYNVVGFIPFLGNLIQNIIYYPVLCPLIFGYSLFNFAMIAIYVYLFLFALTGRCGRIPYVSKIIDNMM